MRLSFVSLTLAGAAAVIAGPVTKADRRDLPGPVPLSELHHTMPPLLSLEEALNGTLVEDTPLAVDDSFTIKAVCRRPLKVRKEWHSMTDNERLSYTNAVNCLQRLPSQRLRPSTNRYEDFVRVHQVFTPNIHLNAKFLPWHRGFLRIYEMELESKCGYTAGVPWFNEPDYAGRFSQSSIFSDRWFGRIALGGGCVRTGQFGNWTINIGPGSGNRPRCIQRNGNGGLTANANQDFVNACNSRTSYNDMATCSERGAHAYGHNGIGGTMEDANASPSDPIFFLHHAFVDHSFRMWQKSDTNRLTSINGRDAQGNLINLDTELGYDNLLPGRRIVIRDVMDTTNEFLCYRYDYSTPR